MCEILLVTKSPDKFLEVANVARETSYPLSVLDVGMDHFPKLRGPLSLSLSPSHEFGPLSFHEMISLVNHAFRNSREEWVFLTADHIPLTLEKLKYLESSAKTILRLASATFSHTNIGVNYVDQNSFYGTIYLRRLLENVSYFKSLHGDTHTVSKEWALRIKDAGWNHVTFYLPP